jgi:glycosyltransferase involved in cell wall biosynthesis
MSASREDPPASFSISTVIPTVGRPSLGRAVQSVLDQSIDPARTEVLVVNDSGTPLPPAAWQASPRVRTLETERPRSGPSAARNQGAAAAGGRFLHFLDDDDWLLPGAFAAFAGAVRRDPSVRWLYGIVERRSRTGEPLGHFSLEPDGNVLAPIMSGEWLPFQGSLVERRLFGELGGFNPAYPVSEDVDLQLRLSLEADLCRVRTPVCVYSEGVEASTTRRDLYAEYLFRAHDALFDRPGVAARAAASATTPHLLGKVLRHCLIALRDNLRAGRPRRAARRLAVLAALLARAGGRLTRAELWRALRSNHAGMRPGAAPMS